MSLKLTSEKAYIFHLVHVENVPAILRRGALVCRHSPDQEPEYVNIGNASLIERRARRVVDVEPGGTLSDYVPFYFTPSSIMLYNIKTGHGGITHRPKSDLIFFVSSLHRLGELGLPFLFTTQHAYAAATKFYSEMADVQQIDWPLLQSRNFKTDDADPGKALRYQAEALVHQSVPLGAVLGLACADSAVKAQLDSMCAAAGATLTVKVTPHWYF